jgi:hypothetical protein
MMFRVKTVVGFYLLCFSSLSFAADLPLHAEKSKPVHYKKMVLHLKKTISKPKQIALVPSLTKLHVTKKPAPVVEGSIPVTPQAESNLSWVLGPMVANADGGKREGSASATANIVVEAPGTSFGPEMIIELEGHVVKTIQSTVRLDIHVGDVKKSVTWNSDEIKSGIFKITINEKVPVGVLPTLIPVSALGFVTQAGEGHAAMVSLEKIVLRFTAPQVISEK